MVGRGVNLADVMDEVAARLAAVDGLRPFAYPIRDPHPPSAIVAWPEQLDYDSTYVRGMDRITVPLVVVVGAPEERASRDRLADYCNGSGPRSVKAAVENPGAGAAFDSVVVTGAVFDVYTYPAGPLLTAIFSLDIAGQGA
jgi:hypothetical protein